MSLVIREAQKEDAAALVAYVQTLADEPNIYLGISPGEFRLTELEEQAYLEKFAASENSIFLLAESGGQIVGTLILRGGERKSTRHSALLGISVVKGWRNQGIGARLIQEAIEWARANSLLQRIELNVFVPNEPAVHLYQKFGFQVEGRRCKAFYRDGKYHDDYIMALMLEE